MAKVKTPVKEKPKEKTRDKASASGRRRSVGGRIARILSIIFSIILALALIACSYSGYVSPLRYGGRWGIVGLCFAPVFWTVIIFLVLQLFYCRKGSLILAVGVFACLSPVLDYFPINFTDRKAPPGSDTISVLTYNVRNLIDGRHDPADTMRNPMMDYVIASRADIVCLQEITSLTINNGQIHLRRQQMDTLGKIYPYIFHNGHGEMFLSKFAATPIHLDVDKKKFDDADLVAYRVTLPDERVITVFSVHLQSFGLHQADRELYHNITDLRHEPLGEVRTQLIDKLAYGNVQRARQANFLMRYIRQYGGPDVIICGDFNDVPGCYTLRTLADAGFHQVYPRVGFGPMITYNADRMWFRIDHVLWRGDLVPLSLKKGTLKASDHYPLTVRFAIPPRNTAPGLLD